VNHWVFSGQNRLGLRMDPLPGAGVIDERAHGAVSLNVRPSGSTPAHNQRITSIEADAHGALEAERVTPTPARGFVAERLVHLTTPFPRWTWLDGQAIQPSGDTRASLFQVYDELWAALHARAAPRILPRFAARTQELATAFGRTVQEMDRNLDLNAASHDPTLELYPLDDEAELEVFGDGRLARLTRWDDLPMIVFVRKDRSLSQSYDVICCMIDGGWLPIR
jgi:hypothetical protein